MIFSKLYRYLQGEVRFLAEGLSGERLISACVREQIPLTNIEGGELGFYATAQIQDYKRIAPLARRYGMRVNLTEKRGLPFFTYKRRKRYGLIAGLLVFLVVTLFLNSRIWRIEVNGNYEVPTEEILENLEKSGVYIGASGRDWDALDVEKDMLLRMNELSFIAVNFRSAAVYVEITERTKPPQRLDKDKEPTNVIAEYGGQIVSMEVYDGTGMVKKGDGVQQGEMLISGIIEGKSGKNQFRNARGKVIADVEEEIKSEICFQQTDYQDTGKNSNQRFIKIGKWEAPLNPIVEHGSIYRTDERKKQMTIFGLPLPVELGVRQYIYMEPKEITLTTQQAKELCIKALEEEERSRFRNGEIISKSPVGAIEGDRYVIRCHYVVRKDISKQIPIIIQ